MKRKIKIVDNIKKTVSEHEVSVPNKMHLDAQIRFPHLVQKDKTKYNRKRKHKNRIDY